MKICLTDTKDLASQKMDTFREVDTASAKSEAYLLHNF